MEKITRETLPDEVHLVKDAAGVVFYEARYGDRWGCPNCLEFRRIDGSRALFGYCLCTRAYIERGQVVDDPAAAWNQPDYEPVLRMRIDWENAEQEAKQKAWRAARKPGKKG